MFRRLLLPLDGSALAEAALPVAARLAHASDAALVLLHMVERGAPAAVPGEPHLTSATNAEDHLRQLADKPGGGSAAAGL